MNIRPPRKTRSVISGSDSKETKDNKPSEQPTFHEHSEIVGSLKYRTGLSVRTSAAVEYPVKKVAL